MRMAVPIMSSGTADGVRPGSDRSRRIRDAVEGSLSDVILLGTEEQVRLAAAAAAELAAGRPVETAALVVCLRDFIRQVLDLQPVPSQLSIPKQGPSRTAPQKAAKRATRTARSRAAAAGWAVEPGAQALAEDSTTMRRLSITIKSSRGLTHRKSLEPRLQWKIIQIAGLSVKIR